MTGVKITRTLWKMKNNILGFMKQRPETVEIWWDTDPSVYQQEVFLDLILDQI